MARANTIPATGTLPPDLAYRLPNPAQPRRGDADHLATLRDALIDGVRGDGPDLTQRQLALLLILVTDPGPHHVRDLAARMQVGKPCICRAMDRLEALMFAERQMNARDLRSVDYIALPAGRFAALALARRLAG